MGAIDIPADAFIVIAGDLNLENRGESALGILKSFLKDEPIPTDQSGDADTNNSRAKPYDFILNSASLRTNFVSVKLGAQSFPNGLIFDSRVYSPLADVAPVQSADSGQAQHMAVLKDYSLSFATTNYVTVAPPALSLGRDHVLRWTAPANLTWTVSRRRRCPTGIRSPRPVQRPRATPLPTPCRRRAPSSIALSIRETSLNQLTAVRAGRWAPVA